MVSEWLKAKNPWADKIGKCLYMPIQAPAHRANLRRSLGIGADELIVGRISRPGLDQGDEVLEIYRKLKTKCRLLVLGGGRTLIEEAKTNPLVIHLPPTTNDNALSDFYNSFDVLLHYRKEGETFGMSIADAMIHGKPVVSHKSFLDNAQVELLCPNSTEPCGIVVEENDLQAHAEKIDLLLNDPQLRSRLGRNAEKRAFQFFEAKAVTQKLAEEYLRL